MIILNKKQNKTKTKTKTVIVLGMHRSGTSITAGILSLMGVNMGRIGPPKISNIKGHFEDLDFLSLNEKILLSHNASWRNPPKKIVIYPSLKNEAKNLVFKKQKILWGWKDPRTVFTIDYYFDDIINPYFIFIHRDSNKVAESLFKRDKTSLEDNLIVIQRYKRRIDFLIKKTKNYPQLFIKMEKIIENPILEANKIASFLNIKITNNQQRKILSFVVPSYKKKLIQKYFKLKNSAKKFF